MSDAWYYLLIFAIFGGVVALRGDYLSNIPGKLSPMASFLFWGVIVFVALQIVRKK